jgi:hypothetical protein
MVYLGWTLQELIAPASVEFFTLEANDWATKDQWSSKSTKLQVLPYKLSEALHYPISVC